jgi:hypothetical protein
LSGRAGNPSRGKLVNLGATIYDLEEAELCYAPQFGSAKDPVNFAGMVAADVLDSGVANLVFRVGHEISRMLPQ